MHSFVNPALAVAAVGLLSSLPTAQAGMYTKSSPVIQVDAKNYDSIVAKSNYTTVLEFYAPWCGHCQNLKPAYEKAAKNLEGLVKIAAIDCDEDSNKAFCGQFGVQGFPTLKIVRPAKKGGKTKKPSVEPYEGPRTAKAIVEAAVDKMNNYVQRVADKDLDEFLSTKNESAKAILFTDKGTTSALLKSVAIDFLDVISVAQIRNKESKAVEMFGIESYPTLVLLPGGDKDSVVYDGEMKKPAIVKFLSQVGEPNPDPATPKKKAASSKAKSSATKESSSASTASEAPEASESAETPVEKAEPVVVPAPPIPTITSKSNLVQECLNSKSSTCILAFVPSAHGESAEKVLTSLAEISHKYAQGKHNLFPFFEFHTDASEEGSVDVLKALELTGEVEIIAVNGKRGWWKHFEASDYSIEAVEGWIDAIRLSEGTKKKLPEGILAEPVVEKAEPVEETESSSTTSAEPEPTVVEDESVEESAGEEESAEESTEETTGHDEL